MKPANLLFDDAGRVRIADFGVARALAEAASAEPSEGLIGTVKYSSPEQAQGRPVDGKADVYSLALVLYECLTGEVPFAADSQVATLHARIGATLPFHPALGELEATLRAATAPDPSARIDAAELLRQLTTLSRELPEPAPPRNGRARAAIGFQPPSPEELTTMPRTTGTRGGSGAVPVVRDADLTEVGPLPDTTIVGAAVVAPLPPPAPAMVASAPASPSAPPPATVAVTAAEAHRRRRWPIVALVLVLVLGGALGAVLAINPFATPTYPIPLVVGQSLTTARTTAASAGFTLVVKGGANSLVTAYLGVLKQEPAPGTKLAKGASIDVIVSLGQPPVRIPTVVGTTPAAATAALTHLGFTVSTTGVPPGFSATVAAGHVLGVFSGNAANPTTASHGSALVLQLSKGPPPLPVPDVVGIGGLRALATLQQSGFKPHPVHDYSRTVHAGNVIATTPVAGTSLQPGRAVLVMISMGAPTTVPSLGGADLANAEKILVDHGLTVVAAHGSTTSHNWTTTPPAGTEVPVGTGVILYGH